MAIRRQGKKNIKLPYVNNTNKASFQETGNFVFNTTNNTAEYFNGTGWNALTSAPVITSASPTAPTSTAIAGGTNITLAGSDFQTATVKCIDQAGTETSATVVSQNAIEIVFTVPTGLDAAQEPFDIKVTNASGLATTLEDAFTIDETPTFTTAAGSLGTLQQGALNASDLTTSTIAATDDEGQTLTFTISSGSLPSGLSLATNGVISGSISSPTSNSTSNFTVQVSDGNNTATRSFSINLVAPPFLTASGGSTTDSGDYRYHIFTGNGTFTVSSVGSDSTYGDKVDYLIVAGGGGGGGHVSGGGGAGGMLSTSAQNVTVSAQGYSITVGGAGGGSGGTGGNGSSSSAFSVSTTGGGGGGGGYASSGNSGGSGGGGGHGPSSSSGGSAVSGQGNSGGTGFHSGAVMGGGGGGKGSAGTPGNSGAPHGGSGAQWSVGPDSNYYAAGGGGGGINAPGGNGGIGGGGGGASQNQPDGTGGGSARNSGGNAGGTSGGSGGSETGSGGGGGGHPSGPGAGGGSGIVIVRYKFQ